MAHVVGLETEQSRVLLGICKARCSLVLRPIGFHVPPRRCASREGRGGGGEDKSFKISGEEKSVHVDGSRDDYVHTSGGDGRKETVGSSSKKTRQKTLA
ncbi:hypothetical protein ElyMa_004798100 [Elysia marginata]|uniref:Uncharacterized protein n=1 Tax=Elysia marginata TaxID=1093978 RepID=A0AAV4IJD0_9GAST|nr:hypothetical protein ElyMa_004798100 [Elysia marginata]